MDNFHWGKKPSDQKWVKISLLSTQGLMLKLELIVYEIETITI